MEKTRLSLFYLAGYLIPAGLLLILIPREALKLLLSNGDYGDVFPRLAGTVLLALGILIVQIIRHRVAVLYPSTVMVRLVILGMLVFLYIYSSDPFFLVIAGIVAIGIVLTGVTYWRERQSTAFV